jgi:hypothetical protein
MAKELRVELICAALEQKCEINLVIYCKCDPDYPSGSIPFGRGFPNVPWFCRKCGKVTENLDELMYDIGILPKTCFIKITDHFFLNGVVFEVAAYKEVAETERLITTCGNSFFINQFEFVHANASEEQLPVSSSH